MNILIKSTLAFARHRLFFSFLCALCALCVLCGQISAQDFKNLKPGIEYAEVTREISGLKVKMNLLRLDLKKVRLDVVHAMDAAIGTELTSSIATRHRAFAAINAGFFRLDKSQFAGDAAGILMIDGHLLSEPLNNRIQLLINNNRDRTSALIARTSLSLAVKFGNHSLNLTGINRERKKDDIVIYTPEFGRTTLTDGDGIEVVVEHGKAASLTTNIGNSVIPKDGFVISAGDKFREALADAADSPAPVSIVRTWDAPADLAKDTTNLDVVAGVPQLIKNGKIDMTWELEKSSKSFVETRHPRTAVAKLKDGKFLMITVDGRTESSGGIGLQDLAEYLLSLGAIDAMNLDGGGSTTMFVGGKVVNHPSDKEGERKVSDAILVTPRTKAKRK